jgi:hypothetical protein
MGPRRLIVFCIARTPAVGLAGRSREHDVTHRENSVTQDRVRALRVRARCRDELTAAMLRFQHPPTRCRTTIQSYGGLTSMLRACRVRAQPESKHRERGGRRTGDATRYLDPPALCRCRRRSR